MVGQDMFTRLIVSAQEIMLIFFSSLCIRYDGLGGEHLEPVRVILSQSSIGSPWALSPR